MKASELATRLATVEGQLTKIETEVIALKEATADADLPPEAVAILDRLSVLTQRIDDINVDSTPPPNPVP